MKKKYLDSSSWNSIASYTKKVVVGIVTLFISVTPLAEAKAVNFDIPVEQERIETVERANPEIVQLPDNIGTIQLESNVDASCDSKSTTMITDAFNEFVTSKGEEARMLEPLNDQIKEAFRDVEIMAVKTSGSVDEEYLNVSLLLPERLVLSINSLKDLDEPGVVSFNLLKNRELIVSDIIPLENLAQYIQKLERSLA